jgi:site-specific recombinase XerD
MNQSLIVRNKADELVSVSAASVVPVVIPQEEPKAEEKFFEFFTARIRNVNTRMGLPPGGEAVLGLGRGHGFRLDQVRPVHVAAYVELFTRKRSAPTVKQHLAAVRELFDYLVVNQVLEMNPAAAVKGPSHSAKTGKTPVLDAEEARQLLDAIDTSNVVGLRDRAIVGLMLYTFARVGALVAMNAEDYYRQGKRWWVRLHEKGGKLHEVPVHHKLEEYLDAYLECLSDPARKDPIFRIVWGKTRQLTGKRMTRRDVYEMVRRRAKDAGIGAAIGCHTFRATGITNYLVNGGTLEKAQQLANHESARTTKLYDRRNDKLTLDEVEHITI